MSWLIKSFKSKQNKSKANKQLSSSDRASFSYLLRVVSACNALFEKQNNLFSVKTFKTR